MTTSLLNHVDFKDLNRILADVAGLQMSPAKRPLVGGRLSDRLGHHGLQTYSDYLTLVEQDPAERQKVLDLLTSTETQFFREARHFGFLADHIAPRLRDEGAMRVWSAGCSTGQEPYTIAMVLLHALGHERFEILASDINTRVLQEAGAARYPIEQARDIPWSYRSSFCLKGTQEHEGLFQFDRPVRERLYFEQINLNTDLPNVGLFDVIFLRNVLTGFALDARRALIDRVWPCIRPGGWLIIGEAENLHGMPHPLKMVRPSIYQRP
ncbi:MAG: protein-glutamate O-methyltransferase CheR [Aquabacterium sp.]